jgi:hypothetical protein
MRHCASFLLLSLLLGSGLLPALGPRAAHAETDPRVRLYWSSWMTGQIAGSPADPAGSFTGSEELGQNIAAGLEAIFLNRVGVSYSRMRLQRDFSDAAGAVAGCATPPCQISERGLEQSLNLTLYAWDTRGNGFNAFAGGGAGNMDYSYQVDGALQTSGELYNALSLSRWFWGIEYTYERIGFRIEISRVTAHNELSGLEARLEHDLRYLTLIIPLN